MSIQTLEIEYSRIAFEASAMAYSDKESIEKWCIKEGYALKTFEKDECFAYVAWGNNKIIVAYRGTNDLRDWLDNADARKLEVGKAKIHKGFHDYMAKVGEDVYKKLDELFSQKVTNNYELILTGHSLGAAAITLFVYEWVRLKNQADPSKTHIHTMGSPRTGNDVFSNQLTETYPNWFRWVNNADSIPHLPLALPRIVRTIGGILSKPFAYFMPGGLRHVGWVCWLDVCGDLHYRPNTFFQWKDIIMGWINHIGTRGLAMIHDHFMADYVSARNHAFWEEKEEKK